MKKRVGFVLLALLAVSVLVFGQSDTFERIRLSAGTTAKLAEVTSAGALLVSSSGTASAAPSDATTFPRVRLAGGSTGNLAEVDSTGHLLVALPSGTVWSAAEGGTGLSTYAIGDLLYASATTPTLAKLADVAAGSYLRSGGVSTAPAWSTATLPDTATAGDLLYASAANVYANRAAVATGQVLASAGTGTAPVWSGQPALTAGVAGGTTYHASGVIYTEYVNAANAADTLYIGSTIYTLPAATLATNGDALTVELLATADATAATRTFQCNIGFTAWDSSTGFTGGINIISNTSTTVSQSFHAKAYFERVAATVMLRWPQRLETTTATLLLVAANTSSITWANAQDLKCHVKSSVGTAGAVTLLSVRVGWIPR